MFKYKYVGIDLGENVIKIAHIRPIKDSIKVEAVNYFEVEKGLELKDYVRYLKKCIQLFLKVNHINYASLSFSISSYSDIAEITFLDMPIIKKRFIEKNTRYELENSDLGHISDLYIKWAIAGTDEETNMNRIIALSLKREIITELSKISGIKLKLENIELQPLTLGRGLDDNTCMVIDFGHDSTRVNVYKEGNLFSSNVIWFGGKNIDLMIREEFERPINNEELDDIKFKLYAGESPYSIQDDGMEVVESVSRRLNVRLIEVRDEIKRFLRAIELQHDIFINDIHLTGGLSNLQGFGEFFSYELGVDIRMLNSIKIHESSKLSDIELNAFYLAISTACFKEKPYMKNLNYGKLANTQIDYTSILALILCASMVTHIATYRTHHKYQEIITSINSDISRQAPVISGLNGDVSSFNNSIELDRKYIQKIESLDMQNKWLSDVLYVLSEETPQETIIGHVKLQNKQLVVNGYSQHYSGIGFLAMGLEKYGVVSVDEITNDVLDEVYTQNGIKMTKEFQLTLSFKDDRLLEEETIESIQSEVLDEDDEELKSKIDDLIEESTKDTD